MNRKKRRNAFIGCSRCGERVRTTKAHAWNVIMKQGRPVGALCSNCQTPEENAEAEINEATIDYGRAKINAFGQLTAPAKSGADDD